MKKRLLLIALPVLLLALLILIAFNVRKANPSLRLKGPENASISGLSDNAEGLETKGDLPGAKAAYQKLINDFPNSGGVAGWQSKLEDLNMKLIFSRAAGAKSAIYTVKPADTLAKIAREFKTTAELIRKSNGLSGDRILPGNKLKIWTRPFSIVVDKSQNTLILKSDEEIVKTYVVSTGANNSTPVGNFKIVSKLENPTWFKAGAVVPAGSPENILGTRWLGLNLASYGIHGTTEPRTLGTQVTQGCVRMANSEVEELYAIVPEGTEVTIID